MIVEYYYKGKRIVMEQFIELLPTIIGALLIVGGGVFALVRWLFSTTNETVKDLQQEVRLLRQDNKLLFQEICDLREQNRKLRDELHTLTRLLEERAEE